MERQIVRGRFVDGPIGRVQNRAFIHHEKGRIGDLVFAVDVFPPADPDEVWGILGQEEVPVGGLVEHLALVLDKPRLAAVGYERNQTIVAPTLRYRSGLHLALRSLRRNRRLLRWWTGRLIAGVGNILRSDERARRSGLHDV